MSSLVEADQVEVLVVVDNVTDNLSSTPLFVENEWPRLWTRGMRALSGRCLCCAAHGLSCAITVRRGAQARTLLFDTGPDEVVFERNVERLGFDIGSVEGIVLSHGHWDHSGAMLRALQMIRQRNGGREVPTYNAPRDVPNPRYEGCRRFLSAVRRRAKRGAANAAWSRSCARDSAPVGARRPCLHKR